MVDPYGQGGFGLRLEWGPVGARATQADISVVVDVLSFSTSVTVAVERGMRVFPYRWQGAQAEAFAAQNDAVLAVGRLEATREDVVAAPSLSPARLMTCKVIPRLVLPSPNGSTIAAALAGSGSTVVVGCLRNAAAVAAWLVPAVEAGRSVAVIAAGERWHHDNSLRPALEDHLGAGAILSALAALGHSGAFSPEASAAVDVFEGSSGRLDERMHRGVGGQELIISGFAADVAVAADLNSSSVVPVLHDGAFEAAGGR